MVLSSLINFALFVSFPFFVLLAKENKEAAKFIEEIMPFVSKSSIYVTFYAFAFKGMNLDRRLKKKIIGVVAYIAMNYAFLALYVFHEKKYPIDHIPQFAQSKELRDVLISSTPEIVISLIVCALGYAKIVLKTPFAFTLHLWIVYYGLSQLFLNEVLENTSKFGATFSPVHPQAIKSAIRFSRDTQEVLTSGAFVTTFLLRPELEALIVNIINHVAAVMLGYIAAFNSDHILFGHLRTQTTSIFPWSKHTFQPQVVHFVILVVCSFNIHYSILQAMSLARITGRRKTLFIDAWTEPKRTPKTYTEKASELIKEAGKAIEEGAHNIAKTVNEKAHKAAEKVQKGAKKAVHVVEEVAHKVAEVVEEDVDALKKSAANFGKKK